MFEKFPINRHFNLWDFIKTRISAEGLLKLASDVVLMNLAIFFALVARLLYIIAFSSGQPAINYQLTLWEYVKLYANNAWLLTLIGIFLFIINGFYTYGRFYEGKYKILIVIQAVTVTYLLFGFMSYLAQGPLLAYLQNFLNYPRGALILAWLFTTGLLVASRTWVMIWDRIVRPRKKTPAKNGKRAITRVLVIGGAGYIGSALLPMLLAKGYQVRILDLLIFGTDPIKPWLNHPQLEVIKGDFRQIDVVVRAMQDVDAVIHLGAIVGDLACSLNEKTTLEINLMATKIIAEIAKGYQVGHFIFASTCSVYGASNELVDERAQINPVTLYARTKAASEKALLKMADERFSPTILRFSTVYGLSGRYRFDLVVNLLTAKAMFDREITIFGGNQWRSFVHVEDAAKAIIAVLGQRIETVRGEVFNVGSSEQNYTITQIGDMIHSHIPAANIINKTDEIDPQNYRVSCQKIHRMLNYEPRWTVENGIEQVVNAIRGGMIQDYRDARFSNIKFLSEAGMNLFERHEEEWTAELLSIP